MTTKAKSGAPEKKAPTPEAAEPSDAELLNAAEAFEKKHAAAIQERIQAGLTREQALEVQRTQVAHDLALAKDAK